MGVVFLLTSCEKVVELDYKGNQSRIVIEGNISNQPGPYIVKIRKSVALTQTGAYPTVDNAVVIISDNAGHADTLIAQGNGTYLTRKLQGMEGRTYTLAITAENQSYAAQSTMPERVPFDGIKVEEVIFGGETEFNIIPEYVDPAQKGNNYRFELSANDKLMNQHFVQNDEVKNGLKNTARLELSDDEDLKLKRGDVITLKMQCVDAKVALYYKTLALIGDSGPGGGITPNNPPGNISNGALGVFSAHTSETKSITIP
ncbi:protein of unknown function [Dyadobacter soli]|uniref:DUF4249 domain-containing protein n=2 Tax=Dyadobacter soli TaxID=659014 RepID=A0A1G7SF66_9BACT|nr:protein of unknown function [Dyadobacter soli]